MSSARHRSNTLEVLSDFSDTREEEEVSGIHTRHIGALLAETIADEGLPDVVAEEDTADVNEAALPPPPMSSRTPLVASAVGAVAIGCALTFFFARPAAPAPSSPATMAATPAPSIVDVPKMSIPTAVATVATVAPIASAEPLAASKPPPTLADGDWMLRHGQVPRAEAIYRSVLASGASECEALTGLGKVALANRQPSEALAFFERALARQPQYYPARLGRADALWDSGRRDAAKAHYAAIRERYSSNDVPPRVLERTR